MSERQRWTAPESAPEEPDHSRLDRGDVPSVPNLRDYPAVPRGTIAALTLISEGLCGIVAAFASLVTYASSDSNAIIRGLVESAWILLIPAAACCALMFLRSRTAIHVLLCLCGATASLLLRVWQSAH